MSKKWVVRCTFEVEDWCAAVTLLKEFKEVRTWGDTVSSFQLEELHSCKESAKNE